METHARDTSSHTGDEGPLGECRMSHEGIPAVACAVRPLGKERGESAIPSTPSPLPPLSHLWVSRLASANFASRLLVRTLFWRLCVSDRLSVAIRYTRELSAEDL